MLDKIAKAIWNKLGANERANTATTIAVVKCKDKKIYCTSNDVSAISAEAIKEAKKQGVSPIANEYISMGGAGFHAEMWAVIQAMHADKEVSNVISKVGASRPCCKNCADVLAILNIEVESKSDDVYNSWYNPLTVNEECKPRADFKNLQYKHIPDFRNNSIDYWFTPGGKDKPQKKAPNTAK